MELHDINNKLRVHNLNIIPVTQRLWDVMKCQVARCVCNVVLTNAMVSNIQHEFEEQPSAVKDITEYG